MRRASTPIHEFQIPMEPNEIARIKLTYSQNDKIILEKEKGQFTYAGDGWWTVELTQEETNLFKADAAECQLRIMTTDGKVIPSQVMKLCVGPVLNDEVMTL